MPARMSDGLGSVMAESVRVTINGNRSLSRSAIATAVTDEMVKITVDGREMQVRKGRDADQGRPGQRQLHPSFLLPLADEAGGDVPDVSGRDRDAERPCPDHGLHQPGGRRDGGRYQVGGRQEGTGRRPRVSAHQPSPRLPGVRSGGRVPAPGSHHRLRPGRVAFRRGEAAFRKADSGLGPGLPGSGTLHPLCPLHQVLRRGLGRSVDRVHRSRQLHPDQHLSRTPVLVLLLRQHGSDLPGRCPHRPALSIPGPALGPGGGRVDLPALHLRRPDHGPGQPERGPPIPRGRCRGHQLGLAVRQVPLRLSLHRVGGSSHHAAHPPGGRLVRRGLMGRGPRPGRLPARRDSRRRPAERRPGRCPRDQRGRLRACPSSPGWRWGPTMSTPRWTTASSRSS